MVNREKAVGHNDVYHLADKVKMVCGKCSSIFVVVLGNDEIIECPLCHEKGLIKEVKG